MKSENIGLIVFAIILGSFGLVFLGYATLIDNLDYCVSYANENHITNYKFHSEIYNNTNPYADSWKLAFDSCIEDKIGDNIE